MQWINVRERLPAKRGSYTVITKPIRGKWSQRYATQMSFDFTMGWVGSEYQSTPIYWLEVDKLPGPTRKRV